jgi:hypothetical protein
MTTKPDFITGWTEPESAANTDYQPVYPYNNVTQTKGGHSFEMDDTPTRERIRLQHGKGSFLEMHPNGDEVHKIIGDGYEITLKDKNMLVKGKLNITVEGDAYLWVQGNKIEQVDGSVEQYIKGDFTQTVEGRYSSTSMGDYEITAGTGALGKLILNMPNRLSISGDLSVGGTITGQLISSRTRVDATTGMSAGPLGFVTVTGGISVGIPAAVPGQIVCAGLITSMSQVVAPLGTFGVSGSILAYDAVNEMIRKVHNHISPVGPTTPPLAQEVTA